MANETLLTKYWRNSRQFVNKISASSWFNQTKHHSTRCKIKMKKHQTNFHSRKRSNRSHVWRLCMKNPTITGPVRIVLVKRQKLAHWECLKLLKKLPKILKLLLTFQNLRPKFFYILYWYRYSQQLLTLGKRISLKPSVKELLAVTGDI